MNIVCIAGAGLSTASGIPDFKGPNGLYKEDYKGCKPEEILHVSTLGRNPQLFYDFLREKMYYPEIEPNAAHYAIKELEDLGILRSIITQNIDDLESKAGIQSVRQIHGTLSTYHCISCGKHHGSDYPMVTTGIPRCQCGGIIRPDVVLYGETLTEDFNRAVEDVIKADILLVIGTSLSVYPAASLVDYFEGECIVVFDQADVEINHKAYVTRVKEPLEQALPNFVKGLKLAGLEAALKKGE